MKSVVFSFSSFSKVIIVMLSQKMLSARKQACFRVLRQQKMSHCSFQLVNGGKVFLVKFCYCSNVIVVNTVGASE